EHFRGFYFQSLCVDWTADSWRDVRRAAESRDEPLPCFRRPRRILHDASWRGPKGPPCRPRILPDLKNRLVEQRSSQSPQARTRSSCTKSKPGGTQTSLLESGVLEEKPLFRSVWWWLPHDAEAAEPSASQDYAPLQEDRRPAREARQVFAA